MGKTIQLWVNEEEKRSIEEKAKKEKRSVSNWLKCQILKENYK